MALIIYDFFLLQKLFNVNVISMLFFLYTFQPMQVRKTLILAECIIQKEMELK